MDDCPNCHTLIARLDNAEADRRRIAANVKDMQAVLYQIEIVCVRADRGYFGVADHASTTPETDRARIELAAALMDLDAARRRLKKALAATEDRCADLADALAAPVESV